MLRHVSRWSTGALGNTLLNSRAHTWIHVHTLNSSTLSFHPLNLYVHSVRLDLSLCHSHSVRSTYHQCLESYVIYHNASNITSYNLFYLNYFLFCTLFFALKSVVRGTYNSTCLHVRAIMWFADSRLTRWNSSVILSWDLSQVVIVFCIIYSEYCASCDILDDQKWTFCGSLMFMASDVK